MNQGARDENEAMWRRQVIRLLEEIASNTRPRSVNVIPDWPKPIVDARAKNTRKHDL